MKKVFGSETGARIEFDKHTNARILKVRNDYVVESGRHFMHTELKNATTIDTKGKFITPDYSF